MDAIKFELLLNLFGIKTKGKGFDASSITSGVIDPSRLPESGLTSLFMYNDASDVSTYKKLLPSPSTGGAQTVVVSGATGTGVAQAWVTEPNSPNKTYLPIGIIHAHIHAKKTGAGNVTLVNEIYKRDVAGTETLLFTTDSTPNLTTSEVSYNLEQYNDAIVSLNSTDRIVIKTVYTVTSGTPTITIYFEDAYLSRVEMPFSTIVPFSAGYFAKDTLANLYTNYPPASYVGYEFLATDVGINGTKMVATSTMFVPASGGRALIDRLTLPVVKSPTFTGTTNGAITWGTSAGTAFAKCFCYYPANSLVASHAAGFYYTEMSTTTAAIVYNNTYTPAAGVRPTEPVTKVAFSGAVPGGAGSTAEITAFIYPLVGGLLGDYGSVMTVLTTENSTSANNKSVRHRLDGNTIASAGLTTSSGAAITQNYQNKGSQSYQRCGVSGLISATNVDTSVYKTGAITLQTASSATDWIAISFASISIEVA